MNPVHTPTLKIHAQTQNKENGGLSPGSWPEKLDRAENLRGVSALATLKRKIDRRTFFAFGGPSERGKRIKRRESGGKKAGAGHKTTNLTD